MLNRTFREYFIEHSVCEREEVCMCENMCLAQLKDTRVFWCISHVTVALIRKMWLQQNSINCFHFPNRRPLFKIRGKKLPSFMGEAHGRRRKWQRREEFSGIEFHWQCRTYFKCTTWIVHFSFSTRFLLSFSLFCSLLSNNFPTICYQPFSIHSKN